MVLTDQFDVLVACECSGIVRDALIAAGVRAISCDLKPTQRPGPHWQGDVREILGLPWLGLIAHPVCRYLTNAGAKHLYRRVNGKWAKAHGPDPERWRLMLDGAEFFVLFDQAGHIPFRCVENPIMHGHAQRAVGRPPTQYVQPWWFGDPFSKATGLHLTALPKLVATHKRSDYAKIRQEVWLMAPGPDREEKRSQTYPGIARAIATQWGPLLSKSKHTNFPPSPSLANHLQHPTHGDIDMQIEMKISGGNPAEIAAAITGLYGMLHIGALKPPAVADAPAAAETNSAASAMHPTAEQPADTSPGSTEPVAEAPKRGRPKKNAEPAAEVKTEAPAPQPEPEKQIDLEEAIAKVEAKPVDEATVRAAIIKLANTAKQKAAAGVTDIPKKAVGAAYQAFEAAGVARGEQPFPVNNGVPEFKLVNVAASRLGEFLELIEARIAGIEALADGTWTGA